MKKLWSLKTWFSIKDAAERIGAGIGETVTEKDVLQLIIDDHLPVSWYVRGTLARAVVPFTELTGKGINPKVSKWVFAENPEDANNHLLRHDTWVPIHDFHAVQQIKGIFRLELNECSFMRDWLKSLFFNESFSAGEINGLIMSDSEGVLWQQMQRRSDTWEGSVIDPNESDKLYEPSSALPSLSELVITREDIEQFEHSLKSTKKTSRGTDISIRSEKTYLHIIGALLDVIEKGIPSSDTTPSLGPATGFSSEAKLISAISTYFDGYEGLSTRNLQSKLPKAKRSLKYPD